jgi:hypothetical protein
MLRAPSDTVASSPADAGDSERPTPAVTDPAPTEAEPGAAGERSSPPPAAADEPATGARPKPAEEKPRAAAVAAAPVPAGNGTLIVMTRPFQPCDFFIDGKPYSEAVGSIRAGGLAQGSHSVKVVGRDGVAEFDFKLVKAGVIERIAELPGADTVGDLEVRVSGTPAARIIIDGAQYPTLAPCTVRGLAPGTHRLRAIGQGARPQIVDVTVDVSPHGSGAVDIPFTSPH